MNKNIKNSKIFYFFLCITVVAQCFTNEDQEAQKKTIATYTKFSWKDFRKFFQEHYYLLYLLGIFGISSGIYLIVKHYYHVNYDVFGNKIKGEMLFIRHCSEMCQMWDSGVHHIIIGNDDFCPRLYTTIVDKRLKNMQKLIDYNGPKKVIQDIEEIKKEKSSSKRKKLYIIGYNLKGGDPRCFWYHPLVKKIAEDNPRDVIYQGIFCYRALLNSGPKDQIREHNWLDSPLPPDDIFFNEKMCTLHERKEALEKAGFHYQDIFFVTRKGDVIPYANSPFGPFVKKQLEPVCY